MKKKSILLLLAACISACGTAPEKTPAKEAAITGTWRLISGTLIEKGDTVVTDYTKGKSFIKIMNDTHFAFLLHDLNKGKDTAAVYSSGGGTYTLKDSTYTEHLEYCTDRNWEGHDFPFTVTLAGDTLVQKGVEKIDSLGINRLNIERYVRVNP